jgi:hypothetical protein
MDAVLAVCWEERGAEIILEQLVLGGSSILKLFEPLPTEWFFNGYAQYVSVGEDHDELGTVPDRSQIIQIESGHQKEAKEATSPGLAGKLSLIQIAAELAESKTKLPNGRQVSLVGVQTAIGLLQSLHLDAERFRQHVKSEL